MANSPSEKDKLDFSRRLIQALKHAGIEGPLREKAEKVGISKSYFGRLLKGEQWPSMNRSLKLAKTLGVRHEWLMNGEPPMTRAIASGMIDLNEFPEDVQKAIQVLIRPYQ